MNNKNKVFFSSLICQFMVKKRSINGIDKFMNIRKTWDWDNNLLKTFFSIRWNIIFFIRWRLDIHSAVSIGIINCVFFDLVSLPISSCWITIEWNIHWFIIWLFQLMFFFWIWIHNEDFFLIKINSAPLNKIRAHGQLLKT